MSDIIPFGKYKGQEIEQVRQRDPQYLQWLVQQAWFGEKFAPIYQLVVNNFAPPSEDTPAHNALQVRFLEFNFRSAFWGALGKKIDWGELNKEWDRNTIILRAAPGSFRLRKEWEERKAYPFYQREREEHAARVRKRWETWRLVRNPPHRWCSIGSPQFEGATDVEFNVRAAVGHKEACFNNYLGGHYYRVLIEIKPCMGDDYPAVLRQIKRQMVSAGPSDGAAEKVWVLLLDEFGSNTVTLDQVRLIFAHEGIEIVLLADVREQLIALQR